MLSTNIGAMVYEQVKELKTLKQQIDKYLKDLDNIRSKNKDQLDSVERGIIRGEQIALEWVLERMEKNADGRK